MPPIVYPLRHVTRPRPLPLPHLLEGVVCVCGGDRCTQWCLNSPCPGTDTMVCVPLPARATTVYSLLPLAMVASNISVTPDPHRNS